jgi:hypothetical protein
VKVNGIWVDLTAFGHDFAGKAKSAKRTKRDML